MTGPKTHFEKIEEHLKELGFLHVSGDEIPNVRELLTGKKSKGSWWADPAAHQIFAITQSLEDHPDVTTAKLVSNKVTFVHRRLWPTLFAVAAARDDWQLQGLSKRAVLLLKQIDRDDVLLTNKIKSSSGTRIGDVARELELRLLVHSEQFHTESGAHAKRLETWETWAKRVNLKNRHLSSTVARRFIEKRLKEINAKYSGRGRLPW
jgi:hypothetical protein